MARHHDLACSHSVIVSPRTYIKNVALPELFKASSVLHWQNLYSWLCWPQGAKSIKSARNLVVLRFIHHFNSFHYFFGLSQFTDQFSFAEKATFPKTTCHPKGSHSRSDLHMGSLREARKHSDCQTWSEQLNLQVFFSLCLIFRVPCSTFMPFLHRFWTTSEHVFGPPAFCIIQPSGSTSNAVPSVPLLWYHLMEIVVKLK